ncbi:MAG: zinc-binding dehydrogenase [Candidatus Omnitrophica bacterium]|nr:zinc-binding dehydrogenase [Candidatus Omnitrophota bacterium]
MRAVVLENHGDFENLQYTYVPRPVPGPEEVLIKVRACALNHLDLWTLKGMPGVKISFPHILGCDIAGEIAEMGSRVKGLPTRRPVIASPGISCGKCSHCKSGWDSLCDHYRIVGFQIDGGFAEYVKVPARNVIRVSRKLSFEEWAAVPLVFLTAWHMLVTRARLQKREKILIHAAGSGVGSAALQIAKLLGAHVIATVGSDEKIKRAKHLGADEVINYEKKDFLAEIKKITHGAGVEVVLEHIGPATFSKSLAALSKKGRMVTCGATSGPLANLDLRFLFVRQLSVEGCYMGGLEELRKIIRLVRKKKLKAVVDKVFPLREAKSALQRMQDRENFGKIILVP